MKSAYIAAFSDTIEYCDWKPEQIAEEAKNNIKAFLAGKRRKPLSCSNVVIVLQSKVKKETIIGAALVVETKSGKALLDMLFVIPEWQRKGIATTLVSSAINELYQNKVKTLISRHHAGNEQSKAWHKKFGFVELPDLSIAKLYYHQASNELWRREKLGDLNKSEREQLIYLISRL